MLIAWQVSQISCWDGIVHDIFVTLMWDKSVNPSHAKLFNHFDNISTHGWGVYAITRNLDDTDNCNPILRK